MTVSRWLGVLIVACVPACGSDTSAVTCAEGQTAFTWVTTDPAGNVGEGRSACLTLTGTTRDNVGAMLRKLTIRGTTTSMTQDLQGLYFGVDLPIDGFVAGSYFEEQGTFFAIQGAADSQFQADLISFSSLTPTASGTFEGSWISSSYLGTSSSTIKATFQDVPVTEE